MVVSNELLEYLAEKYIKEDIGTIHMVMFDDFVELWVENKWNDFARIT
jgi:hypothetical protein